jgi:ribose transport system substrate-binding protein
MKKRINIMVAIALCLCLILTACGGGGSTDTSTEGDVQATADLAGVAGEIEQYLNGASDYSVEGAEPMNVPEYFKDKSIYIVVASYQTPFNYVVCDRMVELCKAMGIKVGMYPGDGTNDSWIAGVENGVNQGYDILLLYSGVECVNISSQLEYAESKGVPSICVHYHDQRTKDTCEATYTSTGPYYEAGYALALRAIEQCEGEGNVAIVTCRSLTASTLPLEEGIEEAFGKFAPDMGRRYINVPVPEWETKIQTEVSSALRADPDCKYVIGIYDGMLNYIVAGAEDSGKTGSIGISGYNGSPFGLDLVNKGTIDTDLGESLDCMAYTMLDQTFRALMDYNGDGGTGVLPDQNPALFMWTKDNVAAAIEESGMAGYGGYDESYVDYYKTLWSLPADIKF